MIDDGLRGIRPTIRLGYRHKLNQALLAEDEAELARLIEEMWIREMKLRSRGGDITFWVD